MLTLLPILLSAAALLLTIYFGFRTETREDGQTTVQRLRKAESALTASEIRHANHEARQQGFQTEIEGVADHAERERKALIENFKRDIDSLKEQIKDVPTMRELLFRMVERLENTGKTVDKLDLKLDRIAELLNHK